MMTAALFALLLTAQCPPAEPLTVPPNIGAFGYGFVMEIAGSTVDSALGEQTGQSVVRVLPDGGTIRITFDRLTSYAHGPSCTPLRVTIMASVCVDCGGVLSRSRATILLGANMNILGGGADPLVLEVQPLPEAIVATSDAADSATVEALIAETGPQLADKLRTVISLEGLGVVAAARANGGAGGISASAYPLGFQWVLQVNGAANAAPVCSPRVFLQGNTFTLVLGSEIMNGLAAYHYRAGSIPRKMNADGVFDEQGDISLQGLDVHLQPETLVVAWHGVRSDSRQVDTVWRMQFVPTIDGLALQIREITVDGQSRPVPEAPINPFDELVRGIAAGPKRVGLLASPMGRMRITTGAISCDAVIIAGRV